MYLIEITQDGAGIANRNDPRVDGFLTGQVETCSVYVFYGEYQYAMVHDTAQIAIEGICQIARKCGPLQKAFYAVNPLQLSNEARKAHQNRRGRLKNLLRPKRGIEQLEIPDGVFTCLKNGRVLLRDVDILSLNPTLGVMPDYDIRKGINLLNNLFASKNSQRLPVDFRFNIDHYTTMSQL